jgi:hypothetical protein
VSSPGGFPDEAGARGALAAHCEAVGLAINWSEPEIREANGRRSFRYSDPRTGLNATAELVYERERLVDIGISMAI